jgi:hypothetical protein
VIAGILSAAAITLAQDQWQVIKRGTAEPGLLIPSSRPSNPVESVPAIFEACGERASSPEPEINSIAGAINKLWGSSFPVYETVAPEVPHASPGGCIFYNRHALRKLMTARLGVNSHQPANALVWAIFAHEIGHQVHGDLLGVRAAVSNETKELEADRFAGYTLEKLGIEVTNLAPFWNMTGDEFGHDRYSHGSSSLRTAAFIQGWHLAEWNRAEDSEPVTASREEAVAPDSPDGAPDIPP